MIYTPISLLKLFSKQENYEKYAKFINPEILDSEINTILSDIKAYYKKFSAEEVNWDEFRTWFHHYRHPDHRVEQADLYKQHFDRVQGAEEPDLTQLIVHFQRLDFAHKLHSVLEKDWNIDVVAQMVEEHKTLIASIAAEVDPSYVKNDLALALDSVQSKKGLHWRLKCLETAIGPIDKGQLIVTAAFVDVGKTAFAISETVHMASQLKEGCVLFLNNEEDDRRILRKIWKSALNLTDAELSAASTDPELYKKLEKDYAEFFHGDSERIKLYDIRGFNITKIKSLVKQHQPKLIIVDQVDKINTSYKAFSDHDRLKNLYGEIRSIANQFAPVIAISQADATTAYVDKETQQVEYQMYPHHRQLDGSKVGKPGEADAIIMIGRRSSYANTRGIHVSKNKMGNTIKSEVQFDGDRIRYDDFIIGAL